MRCSAYHGGDLSVSLQVLNDLALVDGFNSCEQPCLADSICLVSSAQVVKLAACVGHSVSALCVREDANATADGFSCGLESQGLRSKFFLSEYYIS